MLIDWKMYQVSDLKSKVDKFDVEKLLPVPVDLNKLNDL